MKYHAYFGRLSSSLTGDNLQAIFITTLRELIFIDRWGSFLMPDTSFSWPVCSFSCFVIIICVAELDQCWRGPRERRIRVTPRAPIRIYLRVNNETFCCYVLPKRRTFCLFFVLFCLIVCLFVLINEASWWTWDSQIRWCLEIPSMTQARPHCAFSWLLDKLRWTQAMVLLSHIFWSKTGSGFSEPDSTLPPRIFRSTPWETWSLVASLPVSIHLLIINCFNDLHDLYDHDKFCVCL